MHDNHTFKEFRARSIDDLIEQWRKAMVDDTGLALCPIIVLSGDKELRRVGRMLHPAYKTPSSNSWPDVDAFRAEVLADPDISRLMEGQ
jgi:hypothetical protein